MSTISGMGGARSAWATQAGTRGSEMKQRMFARVDSDGSGSVDASELQTAIDTLSKRDSGFAQALGGSTGAQLVTKFDSNGDGSLSADELGAGMKSLRPAADSTVDFANGHRHGPPQMEGGGGPPPAPPAAGGSASAGSSSSSASSSSFDPLDTNQDSTVSASERAAGDAKALLTQLMQAIDGNGDGQLSSSEADTFKQNVEAALTAVGAATPSASGAGAGADAQASASSGGDAAKDLDSFIKLVLQQYQQMADASAGAGAAGNGTAAIGATVNATA